MTPATWTDDELREVLAADGGTAVPTSACPKSDLIWRAATETLPSQEAQRVIAHVSRCAFCSRAWDLAADIEAHPSSAASRSFDLLRYLPKIAAAALILIVVAVGAPRLFQTEIERGPTPTLATSMAPNAVLSSDDPVLRWSCSGADAFDLRVTWSTAEDGGVVTESEALKASPSGETIYPLTEQALEGVPPDALILWRVTARSGDEVLDERTFSIRLEGAASSH